MIAALGTRCLDGLLGPFPESDRNWLEGVRRRFGWSCLDLRRGDGWVEVLEYSFVWVWGKANN